MNKFILSISILGCLLFSAIFSSTYLARKQIEESATHFISKQVENETRKHLHNVIELTEQASQAKFIKNRYSKQIEELQNYLASGLPELIAQVVAEILSGKVDKESLEEDIRKGTKTKIQSLIYAISNLDKIISGKYYEILNNLIVDIRIFSGSNTALFIITIILLTLPKFEKNAVFLPATFLILATVVSSLFYIFNQDWFYSIIFNNYVGFSYLGYVSAIFIFQCDIVFNKARITSNIISSIGSAIPS